MISKILKLVCVTLSFSYLLRKHFKIKIYAFNIWSFAIILLSVISITWSQSTEYAINGTETIILNYLCIFFMIQILVQKDENTNVLINSVTLFPVLMFTRLLFTQGFSIFAGLRNLEGVSHNLAGMYAALGAVFCYWAIKGKIHTQLNFKILLLLNTIICCLTMSRKAFLYLLIPLILMNILEGNAIKKTRRIIVIILLLSCGYLLIMKIPFFYQYIGQGFDNLLTYFSSESGDLSASGRRTRIIFGLDLFSQKPLLGWGTMNYNYLFFKATKGVDMVIADNNYVDVLVNWGLVGILIYYSLHLFLVFKFIQTFFMKKKQSLHVIFPITLLATLLVCDYGVSAYLYLHSQTYLAIASTMICRNHHFSSSKEHK